MLFRSDTGSLWVPLTGAVLQSALSKIAAQSGTSYKAVSNVVPASTDGTQIWNKSITPLMSTSDIVIDGACYVDHGSNGRKITFAAFRNTTTLIGVACTYVATSAKGVELPFKFVDQPGVNTGVTYTIRCFADLSGTWYVGQGSSALYNGGLALGSNVEIREIL